MIEERRFVTKNAQQVYGTRFQACEKNWLLSKKMLKKIGNFFQPASATNPTKPNMVSFMTISFPVEEA